MSELTHADYRKARNTYRIGFGLSILLTLFAYITVVYDLLMGWALVCAVLVLAILQLAVQALFFLHLGEDNKPRWNIKAFLFMLMVVSILVIGSLWIMKNLNYNMMPHEVDEYIMEKENLYR